jgi:hypothetical protein
VPRLKVSSAVLPIIEINFGKITQSEETVSVFAKDFLYFLNKWVLVDRGRLARGSNCGRRLRRPYRSHIGWYVNVRWARRTAWIEITVHR